MQEQKIDWFGEQASKSDNGNGWGNTGGGPGNNNGNGYGNDSPAAPIDGFIPYLIGVAILLILTFRKKLAR